MWFLRESNPALSASKAGMLTATLWNWREEYSANSYFHEVKILGKLSGISGWLSVETKMYEMYVKRKSRFAYFRDVFVFTFKVFYLDWCLSEMELFPLREDNRGYFKK